jgi:predicted nucleic acid-binding protein
MLVIADTSPLVAIAACDGLSWLDTLFAEVRVPPAVFQEATVQGKPQADKLRHYLKDRVLAIDLHDFVITTEGRVKRLYATIFILLAVSASCC